MATLEYWRGRVDEQLTDHNTRIGKVDARVGRLEKGFWRLGGILAVCGVIASLLGGAAVALALHYIGGS